jgi:hypothetical protein
VRQDTEVTFALARGAGAPAKGSAEAALRPAERGCRLPALAVHAAVARPPRLFPEPLDQLPPVPRLGPFPPAPAAVPRDHRGARAEALAAVPVRRLAVERGVGRHPVPGDDQGRLGPHRAELGGVVGGAGRDGRAGEAGARGVAGDREPGPAPGGRLPPGAPEGVPGRVPAVQTGRVHGGRRLVTDRAAAGRGPGGAQAEAEGRPFVSSRPAA